METTTTRLDATIADVLVESGVTLTEAIKIADALGVTDLDSIRRIPLRDLKASQFLTLAESLGRSADEILNEA